jgi:hypothetical protein
VAKTTYENHVQIRPFWYYASTYYILLFAFSCLISIIISVAFMESEEEFPVFGAFFVFLALFCLGIFVRGRIKKRISTQILLENNKRGERFLVRQKNFYDKKLTSAESERLVAKIEKKSEAAKLLGNLSEVHKEVFEQCNGYLKLIDDELKSAGIGSPRIAGLRKGRDKVRKIHKEHLLKWVANESEELTKASNALMTSTEKIASGKRVLLVLKTASDFYPSEKRLIESIFAVNEFINATKIMETREYSRPDDSNNGFVEAKTIDRDSLLKSTELNLNIEKNDL